MGETRGNPKKESLGVVNPKEDPSWRHTELIPRFQKENYNRDPSWRQKKLFTRCQRETFVPTRFEIQFWVLNVGRGVEYSNIRINGFPFVWLTFIPRQRSGKKTDVSYDFKKENTRPCKIPVIWVVCLILTRYRHSYLYV